MKKIEELVRLGHNHGSLAIHPYFGRMDPALAALLTVEFSEPRDRVLDPFCGSGTVLHEAALLDRRVTGWDSSPLATMISASKLIGINTQVASELRCFAEFVEDLLSDETLLTRLPLFEIPQMPRVVSVSKWFGNQALVELAFLRNAITNLEASPRTTLLIRVSFSRCITQASRQKGESHYTAVDKSDDPGRVLRLFLASLAQVSKAASGFADLKGGDATYFHHGSGENYQILWSGSSAEIIQRDSRFTDVNTEPVQHDLVVTSPPYLMSWDYGLYHKFRFYWMGFDLDEYEESEVGRHLRRQQDDVERYREDMEATFCELARWTRSGAKVAMVNAPSAVYQRTVDTNRILSNAAEMADFTLLWQGTSVATPGPHHGMYASLAARNTSTAGTSGKREHVLVFTRR